MNIETVIELIQSLESAGELSIKERKYLEMAREFKQLVSELSVVEGIHNDAVFITDELYDASPKEVQNIIRSLACMKMPAYARLVAWIKADGVEEFAAYCGEENSVFVEAKAYYRSLPDAAYEFCVMLREGGK